MTERLTFAEAVLLPKWNHVIPKCAMDVKLFDDHITYMHPTKGKRYVHKRRLGLKNG